jgi:hypothetical protein
LFDVNQGDSFRTLLLVHPAYQRGARARVITYPMKNQQPRAKAAAGISSISDKEPSKSDTGFSEWLGIRRHSQE